MGMRSIADRDCRRLVLAGRVGGRMDPAGSDAEEVRQPVFVIASSYLWTLRVDCIVVENTCPHDMPNRDHIGTDKWDGASSRVDSRSQGKSADQRYPILHKHF